MVSPRHSGRCRPPEPRNTRHLEKTPTLGRTSHRVHDTGRKRSQARTFRPNAWIAGSTKTSRETHHCPCTRNAGSQAEAILIDELDQNIAEVTAIHRGHVLRRS